MGEEAFGEQWEEGEVRMTALSSLEVMSRGVLVVLLLLILLLLLLLLMALVHSQQRGQTAPFSLRPRYCCGYYSEQQPCVSCCCVCAAQSAQCLLSLLRSPVSPKSHPHRSCCCCWCYHH